MNETIKHYDMLVEENNDPVCDSKEMKDYMDKWDGQRYINSMELNKTKTVLEIGVGTGRIAVNVSPLCNGFTGIDFSNKSIEKAKVHLKSHNTILICEDFAYYEFKEKYDVIYSSLTFMHFKNKSMIYNKIYDLLNENGRFVLSIDKNQDTIIKLKNRIIEIYPDNPIGTEKYILKSGMKIIDKFETDFANIFIGIK